MPRPKKPAQPPQPPTVFVADSCEQAIAMLIAQHKKTGVFQALFTLLEKEYARRDEFDHMNPESWSTVLRGMDDIFPSVVAVQCDEDGIEQWWEDDSISLSLEKMSDKRTSKV